MFHDWRCKRGLRVRDSNDKGAFLLLALVTEYETTYQHNERLQFWLCGSLVGYMIGRQVGRLDWWSGLVE